MRTGDSERETVYLGAFLNDGADIEPMPLEESGAETFYWQVCLEVPGYLGRSFEKLLAAGGSLPSKAAAVHVLVKACQGLISLDTDSESFLRD